MLRFEQFKVNQFQPAANLPSVRIIESDLPATAAPLYERIRRSYARFCPEPVQHAFLAKATCAITMAAGTAAGGSVTALLGYWMLEACRLFSH
jgi:hypothetical protein